MIRNTIAALSLVALMGCSTVAVEDRGNGVAVTATGPSLFFKAGELKTLAEAELKASCETNKQNPYVRKKATSTPHQVQGIGATTAVVTEATGLLTSLQEFVKAGRGLFELFPKSSHTVARTCM